MDDDGNQIYNSEMLSRQFLRMSAEFLFSKTSLARNPVKGIAFGWTDLLWGFQKELITIITVSRLAGLISESTSANASLWTRVDALRRANLTDASRLLTALAEADEVPKETSKRRWLFLVLLWLFENQEQVIIDELELVYDDFDFPEEMRSFVGYVPPVDGFDPGAHTPEERRARLFGIWQAYLKATEAELTSD